MKITHTKLVREAVNRRGVMMKKITSKVCVCGHGDLFHWRQECRIVESLFPYQYCPCKKFRPKRKGG